MHGRETWPAGARPDPVGDRRARPRGRRAAISARRCCCCCCAQGGRRSRGWAWPAPSARRRASPTGASRRRSGTCRAVRCSGRCATTRAGSWQRGCWTGRRRCRPRWSSRRARRRRGASVAAWRAAAGLVDAPAPAPGNPETIPDLTREVLLFPVPRAHRLKALARADTGGTLAPGSSATRGYGDVHPTANGVRPSEAELRVTDPCGTVFGAGRLGTSEAEVVAAKGRGRPSLGFPATLGRTRSRRSPPPRST